jgi:hypothetical protein
VIVHLKCSSMSHVVDRAKAFLFCDPPYEVVAVKPHGVVLKRRGNDVIFVSVAHSLNNGSGSLPSTTVR